MTDKGSAVQIAIIFIFGCAFAIIFNVSPEVWKMCKYLLSFESFGLTFIGIFGIESFDFKGTCHIPVTN